MDNLTKAMRAAKKTIKGKTADVSLAHRLAMEKIKEVAPETKLAVIQDLGWEVVKMVRNGS